jgi:hypothetical protein
LLPEQPSTGTGCWDAELRSAASLAGALVAQRAGLLLFDAKRQILLLAYVLDLEDVDPVKLIIRPVRNNRWILPIGLE